MEREREREAELMVGHQEHSIYTRSVTPQSCLLQHPEHLSQNDTSVPGAENW